MGFPSGPLVHPEGTGEGHEANGKASHGFLHKSVPYFTSSSAKAIKAKAPIAEMRRLWTLLDASIAPRQGGGRESS
jgi:hypothetical protein